MLAFAAPMLLGFEVRSATEILPDGARPAWTRQGDRIAFDKAGYDGRHDLHVYDVVAEYARCLTCEIYDFRKSHVFNAAWDPAGERIVFQAQRHAEKLDTDSARLLTPDRSVHSDLWVIGDDGKVYFQLTRGAELGVTVFDPRFANEGSLLFWAERYTTRSGGPWGAFQVRFAELGVRRGVPRLGDAQKARPTGPPSLLLVQDATPDDRAVLAAAALEGQDEDSLDLYVIPRDGSRPVRLTHSRRNLDEYARFHPRRSLIAWTTDSELPRERVAGRPLTEIWLMQPDGTDKRRLTTFNDPRSDTSRGATYVGDFEWSPTGDRIAAHLVIGRDEPRHGIWILDVRPEEPSPSRP